MANERIKFSLAEELLTSAVVIKHFIRVLEMSIVNPGVDLQNFRVLINEVPITFSSDPETVQRMHADQEYLLDFVSRSIYAGSLIPYGITEHHLETGNLTVQIANETENVDAPEPQITNLDVDDDEVFEVHEEAEPPTSGDHGLLWRSRGKETAEDYEATEAFLKLRGASRYVNLFADKKSVKSQVWQKLANEMVQAGYNVGVGKEGGERLRQKFDNLKKKYITFVRHVQSTGNGKTAAPPHYEALHAILSGAHNINPPYVRDTLDPSSLQDSPPSPLATPEVSEPTAGSSSASAEEVPHPPPEPTNATPATSRFSHVKSHVRPAKKPPVVEAMREATATQERLHQQFLGTIRELWTEQNQLIREMTTALKEQNAQRQELIALLKKQDEKSKKRRHHSSSSD